MAMPTEVNGQITDAVTQANVSVLAQTPAMAMGTIYQAQANAMAVLFAHMAGGSGDADAIRSAATPSLSKPTAAAE